MTVFRPALGLVAAMALALPLFGKPRAESQPTLPATLEEVTFHIRSDGEEHKIIVTPTPTMLRVDAPNDGLSIIYDPRTEHYIGLEHRNYTYWEFSWPEVRNAVEDSKRGVARLREFGADSLNAQPPPDAGAMPTLDTTVPPPPSTMTNTDVPISDDSGYVWQTTPAKKRIAGFDAVLWTGTSVASDPVQAWCYSGVQPVVQEALAQLRAINEPIALVPVRDLVPPLVFEVVRALAKGGSTPLLITWGGDRDKNRFELTDVRRRNVKPDLFSVPRLYVKTTLVTMDGIGNQKPSDPEAPPQQPVAPLPVPR